MAQGPWFFASPWPGWTFLLACAGFGVLVAWAYRTEPDIPRAWMRWTGGLLRGAILLGIVGLLHEPVRAVASSQSRPWQVLVLMDASRSMTFPDRPGAAATRWEAMRDVLLGDGLLAGLERCDCRVRAYPFAETLGPLLGPTAPREGEPDAAPGEEPEADAPIDWEAALAEIQPDGRATALPDAIQNALRTGGAPDALVVLSDGRSNAGSDVEAAVRAARQRRVAVHTVSLGDPSGFPDLKIDRIGVHPIALLNDRIVVELDVSLRGVAEASTRVTLSSDDGQEDAEDLDAREGSQGVALAVDARRPGVLTLTARVEPVPGEAILENNEIRAQVRVLNRRLRVLLCDGTPRWEFQYVRNALQRDPSVSLGVWLAWAAPGSVREGDLRVAGFPRSIQELAEFDAVILGDLPPGALAREDLENLHRYVTEFGGGLLVVAGERYGTPGCYRGTAIEPLLPVLLPDEPGPWRRLDEGRRPFRMERTPEASGMAPFRLGNAASQHERVWAALPGCFAHAPQTSLKPLALPLVMASDAGRREPVVSLQRAGIGRVLLAATDETWRWRAGVGDLYLYRYWGSLLRTLGVGRLHAGDRRGDLDLGGRDRFWLGEEIPVRAILLEEDHRPSRDPSVEIRVERDGVAGAPLELPADPTLPGTFAGSWAPAEAGAYRLTMRVPGEGDVVREASVEVRQFEMQEPQADPDALRALSRQTDGIAADAAGARRILDAFATPPPSLDTPQPPIPLWNRLPWFLLLLAALGGEWTCRRMANRP